ncbi:hypothetical protein E2C01_032450 [Portunus trituberculatus]|uniref:Uncharacterized protein n=1 Tax=Portunus trituberculatus TaxID=210409 RepID=A0A5B7EXJ1_PORTR|nr:hypothetical protein [Portunus trituberculatus]
MFLYNNPRSQTHPDINTNPKHPKPRGSARDDLGRTLTPKNPCREEEEGVFKEGRRKRTFSGYQYKLFASLVPIKGHS